MIVVILILVIVMLFVGFSGPKSGAKFLARLIGLSGAAFFGSMIGLFSACEMKWLPYSFCGELSGIIHISIVSCIVTLVVFITTLAVGFRK